jgi:hypothetical protein
MLLTRSVPLTLGDGIWMWLQFRPAISSRGSGMSCTIGTGCKALTVKDKCAGNMETTRVIGLSDMPYEVMELILANLSSYAVARISTNCSTFRDVCRRHLARVHKGRIDLAAGWFGRERLIFLAYIIERFLKGQSLNPDGVVEEKGAKVVLVDKSIEIFGSFGSYSEYVYQAGDVHVTVGIMARDWILHNDMYIQFPTLKGSTVEVTIRSSPGGPVTICMFSLGTEDAFGILEGMAFLQGLSCGGFARPYCDLGLPVDARVVRYSKFRQEELKTSLFPPLVPVGSHHTFAVVGLGNMTMDHMQVRQVELRTGVPEPANGPALERSAKGKLHLFLNVEPKRQGFFCAAVQEVWSLVEMLVLQALADASF